MSEIDYQRYQEYLREKQKNLIDDLGSVALSPFTFGIIMPENSSLSKEVVNNFPAQHLEIALGSAALGQRIKALPDVTPLSERTLVGHA